MAHEALGSPLRILLACSRPLVLKSELWEAMLREPAAKHKQTASTLLRELLDLGEVSARGQALRFHVYPPRPPSDLIEQRLAQAVPLVGLGWTQHAQRMDVHRPGEELAALRQAVDGVPGIELYVHPVASPDDVRRFLETHDVDVVHFAGHGGDEGGLYFEDGRGGARRVGPDELAHLIRGKVKLLVVGACHSERALSSLFPKDSQPSGSLPAAVAIEGAYPIPTAAVQAFARSFYASLARGRDLQVSFDAGLEAVRADDVVGQRPMPDGADQGMPSPWKRFRLHGDGSLNWSPDGGARSAVHLLVEASRHRRLPRTEQLFVGRHEDIAATVERLEAPRPGIRERKPQIITLHGEGGIGKTRLAGAVAEWESAHARFPGGIVEVDCAPARDANDLALAMLGALGVDQPEALPDPSGTLAELLDRDHQSRLLVLDNLDDLFAPDNPQPDGLHPGVLLGSCLTASAELRILATCRWPLNLGSDEDAFEIEPLSDEDAEELFVESVHHEDLRKKLAALDGSLRHELLRDLLRATAKMPLALVLAARRVTDPGASLAKVADRASRELLDLCDDPSLTHLPPRLRSVRASLLLSYRHLSEPARSLFAPMSFFPGGFQRSFQPLESLLGVGWQDLADEIVRFALARYDRDRDRYTMLQPVLEFAREELDREEGDAFRGRAVDFWEEVAEVHVPLLIPSQAPPDLLTRLELPADPGDRSAALERWRELSFEILRSEEENLIAAIEWGLAAPERQGERLLARLDPYLDLRALWRTQERLDRLAAEQADGRAGEASRLTWRGRQAIALGRLHRWQDARDTYGGILDGFRRLAQADPDAYLPDVAMTLNNLGNLLANLGEREEARKAYDEALGLYRDLAARYPDAYLPHVATTLNNLGALLANLGQREEARKAYDEALGLYRELASRYPDAYLPNLAGTLNNLGALLADLGEREEARKAYDEALGLRRELAVRYPDAYLPDLAGTLNNLGTLLSDPGGARGGPKGLRGGPNDLRGFSRPIPCRLRAKPPHGPERVRTSLRSHGPGLRGGAQEALRHRRQRTARTTHGPSRMINVRSEPATNFRKEV